MTSHKVCQSTKQGLLCSRSSRSPLHGAHSVSILVNTANRLPYGPKAKLGSQTLQLGSLRTHVRGGVSKGAIEHGSEVRSVQTSVDHFKPAVLPETPSSFPIPPEKLIALAKKVLYEEEVGRKNPDVLAPDFKFEFPIVKLDKKKYLDAVNTFDFYGGFPNYDQNAYDWRVDHYEPQRVWFTVRVTATHTGTLKVFKFKYKPTGRKVYGAPEAYSFTFNEAGKVTSMTGGYVIDNRLGNTNNLGALFGILQGIGVFVPHPQPGTLGWKVGSAVDTAVNIIKQALHFFTFGIFRQKPKLA